MTRHHDPAGIGDSERRSFVRLRIASAAAALAVLGASYVLAPYVSSGPVVCPMHGIFGLPCPSCGLTRAFCALARLNGLAALHYHALSPLLFGAVLVTPAVCAYELKTGTATSRRFLYSSRVAWAFGAAMLLYHAGRLGVWAYNGTLVREYVHTSWTYALFWR